MTDSDTHHLPHPLLPGTGTGFIAPSPPLEEMLDRFYEPGPGFDSVTVDIAPPARPLELLEQLGPSPFERGGFPLVGFLATTYDKVSRYALERGRELRMKNSE